MSTAATSIEGAALRRVQDALQRLDCGPRQVPSGVQARCPAHEDRAPSLSVSSRGDGTGVVVHCHAGCSTQAVVDALDLVLADLFDEPRSVAAAAVQETRRYPYVDEQGRLLFEVVRKPDKQFRQRVPDGRGGWVWKLGDTRRLLYRLPDLLEGVAAGRTVYVVEGEKDTDRLRRAGQVATTNPGGAGKWRPEYAQHFQAAQVVVVADRDAPGLEHAEQVRAGLAGTAANVRVVQAVTGKDVSDHLDAGHPLEDLVPVENKPATGAASRRPDGGAADRTKANRPRPADELVRLANERYRFGRATTGEPFAVPQQGPYTARVLRGGGHSLRAELAAAYTAELGTVPTASALADALASLEGQTLKTAPEPLHLRVVETPGGVRLDLGDTEGTAVDVTAAGWTVTRPQAGPLFRRTDLTGPLPIPERGGDLDRDLRSLLNVSDRDFPLLLGWLVAAMLPDIPHPIALLTGEQGTGKTTTGRVIVELIDPSAVPLRAGPRDEQGWGVAAASSWVVGLDNVSTISPWLSDAMCRAVTGDGVVARRLYSDSDLVVLTFKRVLLLTSIDPGALRGDLAERLVTIELERIAPDQRKTDRQLREAYQAAHPRIFGALLDLTAQVLAALPAARERLTELPRMADFAQVLAALDHVRGTDSLSLYLQSGRALAQDVIDDDPVGAAVQELLRHQPHWRGPTAVLLEELTRLAPASTKGWPASARAVTGRLKRMATVLRDLGIDYDTGKADGARFVALHKQPEGGLSERPAAG